MLHEEIIFAGFGGQGIMFMGKALSYAAMGEGKFVTWMPSYGAEVRGGTAHSMVIVSDTPIACPVVKEPTICIVMNKPSLDKFETRIRERGLLVVNQSLVEGWGSRKDIDVLRIPATDMAYELGNFKVANMIILGALIAKKEILPLGSIIDSVIHLAPEKYKDLLNLNKESVKKGYEYCSRQVCAEPDR